MGKKALTISFTLPINERTTDKQIEGLKKSWMYNAIGYHCTFEVRDNISDEEYNAIQEQNDIFNQKNKFDF